MEGEEEGEEGRNIIYKIQEINFRCVFDLS